MSNPDIFEMQWFLTAGETNAQGRMPITLVVSRAIEIATFHANALGIGYSNLAEHRLGWVLARLTIEMRRYPEINETYGMTTWIEGCNRFFSDRCFEMTDAQGKVIANIRSMWVAIDIDNRKMADLTKLRSENFPITAKSCPVAKCSTPQIAQDAATECSEYTFAYCDLDFNRHVNTVRYIDKVLNLHSLDFHDKNKIERLEVSFDSECHFGDKVELRTGQSRRDSHAETTEIITTAGRRAISVELMYSAID